MSSAEVSALEQRTRAAERAMKRLQAEFESLPQYKKLGLSDAHAHDEGPELAMGDALEKTFTENAKLKYQLKTLTRALDAEKKAKAATPAAASIAPTIPGKHAENYLHLVTQLFVTAIETAFPGVAADPMVAPCTAKIENPGMYQCNAAMGLCKELKGRPDAPKSPRDVATKLIAAAPKPDYVEKYEIAGPGFINIFIKRAAVASQVSNILNVGVLPPAVPQVKVIVDYSSPNIAKEMHVGHLRSTIIGNCLAQVLKFVGHDVLALNHVGDWGTQFGMLIAHLKDKFPDFATVSPPISDLQAFYKQSKKRFDEEPEFNKRAHVEVVKLQSGDPEVTKAWQLICDVSRKEFADIYARLGVTDLHERGESFYQSRMKAVVEDLTKKGLIEDDKENPGRKIMWTNLTTSRIPLIIVKSDGGFTYDTSDLAALRHRLDEEKAEWVIYVVDTGQSEHFNLVFAGARKAGIYDPSVTRVDHVGFGVVLGGDGKKYKTRSGETVRLKDLLDEGVERAQEALQRKAAERAERGQEAIELTEAERQKVYSAVAYGCIKYADLSHNRINDYTFSFDKMLDDKGNTAVYLLYAYTRIRSIVRQPAVQHVDLAAAAKSTAIELVHAKEWQLAQLLVRFPEVVFKILKDLLPNVLCDYLYDLSTAFSEFYDNCYVIEKDAAGTATVNISRLLLTEATARVMERCFALLNISTVEKM
eukprot:m.18705 g.18705  ORF g.18705 m.18705 type:complete len:703 (+) comp3367_c0_seq1:28-2136(+)